MDKKDNNIDSPSSDLKQEAKPTTENQPVEEIIEPTNNIQPEEQGEIEQQAQPETQPSETEKPKKKKKGLFIILLVIFILAAGAAIFITVYSLKDNNQYSIQDGGGKDEKEKEEKVELSEVAIKGNDLDDFDLFFLKTEDDNKNIVYSPLSIKYALTMLNEGAEGESKKQIENVLGAYYFKPYTNSANLSLANALFVNSAKKDKIKEAYSSSLNTNFNANLILDDFASPDNINSWVSEKTFNLVNNVLDETDPDNDYFYLINTLAIDMDWVNEIQPTRETAKSQGKSTDGDAYVKSFSHEKFSTYYLPYFDVIPGKVEFGGNDSLSSNVVAIANRYDIIKELGEDKIRSTVQEEYEKWAEEQRKVNNTEYCPEERIVSEAPDLDEYVNTLSQHYGDLSSSTDFEFYDDDDVKAFAKDLKTYDGTTLQYVGIMPKTQELSTFLKATSAKDLNKTINSLEKIELDSFKDGVITKLTGKIPHFDFDFNLHLIDDLMKLGIQDIFSYKTADLSGITDDSGLKNNPENVYIAKAIHKANITFSNSGIKAGAATVLGGGKGAAGECRFYYDFEVPIEEIDLSFNKPYLFLIRDKDSGEIWFVGSVYKPSPAATLEQ